MDSIPKTISFRTDEITSEKMEKIKKRVFEGRDVSNALILRTAIDFLHDNYGKGMFDTGDTFEIVKAYIRTAFLIAPEWKVHEFEEVLRAVQHVFEEHSQEETEEIASLFNDEEPITVAQLVRFTSIAVPETFLRIMGIDEEEYIDLSIDKLADFLLNKFSEDGFKEKAHTLFKIVF